MKNFFGSIFINRDELREAGIEYPIKVEYYKITNEISSRQKLLFGIQVIKTEYKEKIGVEQRKIENITNSEKEVDKILYQLKENEIEKYSSQAVKYAERSSEREKIAQKVERDADAIKKAEYMQSKIGEEYEGIISSITSFGMFVELPNTVEGLIRFDDLGNEYFIYDEEKKTLQGEKSKKIYKIGDSIKVRVIFADKLTRKVDFEKISG